MWDEDNTSASDTGRRKSSRPTSRCCPGARRRTTTPKLRRGLSRPRLRRSAKRRTARLPRHRSPSRTTPPRPDACSTDPAASTSPPTPPESSGELEERHGQDDVDDRQEGPLEPIGFAVEG